MGVDARIVVYAPDQTTAENGCTAAFARMAELDTMMSDYRKTSELMRLCDKAGGPPVKVSPELFLVLNRAQEVSQLTDGLFDVTIGPLVQLWRKARKVGMAPTKAEVAAARKLVGWKKIKLDAKAGTVQLTTPGMKLDLGAIAKGYADDEAQKALKKFGISHALVEMGGDIVVTSPPPGTKGWTIRVPNAENGSGEKEMLFKDCAISSSGDTEQFVMIGNVKYSHVINPKTGLALHEGVQATVICPDGITADSLSTAFTLVRGRGRARLMKAYPGITEFVRVLSFNTRAVSFRASERDIVRPRLA